MELIIRRCLAYGVVILPHQLNNVLAKYEQYKMPDDVLSSLDKHYLKIYVRGLYLSGQEMAGDWTDGHKLLKGIGFVENKREEGHRVFISLAYKS